VTIIYETRYGYDLTIGEAREALAQTRLIGTPHELTSTNLTNLFLDRIERYQPELRAFVQVLADEARAEAAASDADRKAGIDRGTLEGIPIAIKDIFDVKGVPTRCGSRVRDDAPPAAEDAAVVALLRKEGAVILGKTVTQEFAAGVVSAPARNPWDPTRIPGGSSGGSAVAVAAGLATAAIGSDTGGSIRIPASVTGTVGLKPTYGTVSTRGVFPLAPSLDTVGPIARTVLDAAHFFDAIRGLDPIDPNWAPDPTNSASSAEDLAGIRIGVPRPFFFDRLQPGVARSVEGAIALMRELGAEVVETPWADAALARSAAMIINRVETVEVHADGIREHPHLYGQELLEQVQATTFFPRSQYVRALKAREYVKRSMAGLFAQHQLDALATPTLPATAVPADDLVVRYPDGGEEPVTLAYTRLTQPFNATGQPALSMPCGMDELGLPVGLQLVAKPFGEAGLCRIGSALEGAIDWNGDYSPLKMPAFGERDLPEF
jgi:aspartyl-tRNA(Asn)/glutamyl-tRNA(Gln) amidotransferase subunit A